MKKIFFMVLVLSVVLSGISFSATFNVTNVTKFQTALTTAQSNGENDVINVAAGTYNITTTLTYITDDGDSGHTLTIIGAGASSVLDGGNNVLMLDIDTDNDDNGGDDGGDIEIRNLLFTHGYGLDDGGGLLIYTGNANAVISDSYFQYNTSTEDAGGFYFNSLNGNITVTGNRIRHNSATDNGGGAAIHTQNGSATVTKNRIYDNTGDNGGGLYVYAANNTIVISDNYFRANTANSGHSGGGLYTYSHTGGTVNLINNTFTVNSADWYGGGAILQLARDDSTANIYNNIFWHNTAARPHITNVGTDLFVSGTQTNAAATINLYNNDFSGYADFDTGQSINLTITNTTNYHHGSNLQVDPQFRNSSDLHLRSTSPVINQGLNTAPSIPTTDLDGNNRIINGNVDMGAYEYIEATNTNAPANVPTINEWGIIIFTLLSGVSAVFILRKRHI